jgi:hypothetical protein
VRVILGDSNWCMMIIKNEIWNQLRIVRHAGIAGLPPKASMAGRTSTRSTDHKSKYSKPKLRVRYRIFCRSPSINSGILIGILTFFLINF